MSGGPRRALAAAAALSALGVAFALHAQPPAHVGSTSTLAIPPGAKVTVVNSSSVRLAKSAGITITATCTCRGVGSDYGTCSLDQTPKVVVCDKGGKHPCGGACEMTTTIGSSGVNAAP